MQSFIPRTLASHLTELTKYYPVISLTGPRQSGKTTLLKELFADYRYITFEDIAYRLEFNEDPRGFLRRYNGEVIFDEAQRVPELFNYLQGVVDADRKPARFILSGSQNFLLHEGITQSLAGRVGLARLFPLDIAELGAAHLLPSEPAQLIYRGSFPELYQTEIPSSFFYGNYVGTYLDRDVSRMVRDSNMGAFRQLLAFCAANVGQTLDYSYYAKRLRLSVPTIKTWIDHLVRSYVIFLVGPYFDNLGKRLVKSPKLYFTDTGLVSYLLQFTNGADARSSNFYGALFENLIVADRYKRRLHTGQQHPLYFFRDSNQLEVDLLEKKGDNMYLSEIKASSTYSSSMVKNLHKVAEISKAENHFLEVIYGGSEALWVNDITITPWNA